MIGVAPVDEKGSFNVTVTVPATSSGLHNVTVRDATISFVLRVDCLEVNDVTPPDADAGPDQAVDEDTVVVFDGSGSTDDVGIISHVWTFVDVTPKTLEGENPAYNFTNPGIYVVTLNVSDVGGNSATDSVTVTVRDITSPVAEAGENKIVGEDTIVTLDTTRSADNSEIVSYVWTFVDVASKTLLGYRRFNDLGIGHNRPRSQSWCRPDHSREFICGF
jgi:PKD repeat protein